MQKNSQAMAKSSKVAKKSKSLAKQTDDVLTIKDISKISKEIQESPKNYNKLTALLKMLKASSVKSEMTLIRSLIHDLFKIFNYFLNKRLLKLTKKQTDNQKTVTRWLISKYEEFKMQLYSLWKVEKINGLDKDQIATVKIDILEGLLKLIRQEALYNAPNEGELYFPSSTYQLFMYKLFTCGDLENIREQDGTIDDYLVLEFAEYIDKYWDLKYYLFQELKNVVAKLEDEPQSEMKDSISLLFAKVMTILKRNDLYNVKNEKSILEFKLWSKQSPTNTIYAINQFTINFEKSMIKLISLPLTTNEYKSVLNLLHKRVIPYFNNAQTLLDFLTSAYTFGIKGDSMGKDITIAILALNGLWELMKQYNLEYPAFYSNLYAILTPELVQSEYRARFFRLLELFMGSTHLPSALVGSFIKRLGKLSLVADPGAIVTIVPFVYNLMKVHPTCMLLIHDTTADQNKGVDTSGSKSSSKSIDRSGFIDPFNPDETDPMKTNALESSLWEFDTLLNHFHPNVSALVKIFTQMFHKHRYNMEDFYYWSYGKLIEQEAGKKLRGELGLEWEEWDNLMAVGADGDNSYLSSWTY